MNNNNYLFKKINEHNLLSSFSVDDIDLSKLGINANNYDTPSRLAFDIRYRIMKDKKLYKNILRRQRGKGINIWRGIDPYNKKIFGIKRLNGYILLITFTRYFNKIIKEARKSMGIQEEGLEPPLDNSVFFPDDDKRIDRRQLNIAGNYSELVIKHFQLDFLCYASCFSVFLFLIIYGTLEFKVFEVLDENDIGFFSFSKKYTKRDLSYYPKCHICFQPYLTKDDLIGYINKYWKYIKREMSKIFNFSITFESKNILRDFLIYKWYLEGSNIVEIKNELFKKNIYINKVNIKVIINRMGSKLKKFEEVTK